MDSSHDSATPPRHLQHGPAAVTGGLFPGLRAARLRAAAASSALPQERALADATVVAGWLTGRQRAQYGQLLRSGSDLEEFVERLADERRVVLEEGADPVADEILSARQAEEAARQRPLRVMETLLLLAALACVALLIYLGVRSDALGTRTVPPKAGALAAGGAVALIAAAIVGAVATRRRDRTLLDWAVSRPGQLGRGIPVQHPMQGESAGPAILMALGPAVLIAAAVIGICAGAAVLLITLLSRDGSSMAELALWGLVGGVAAFVVAVLWNRLRYRRLELMLRRARAAEWFGEQPRD